MHITQQHKTEHRCSLAGSLGFRQFPNTDEVRCAKVLHFLKLSNADGSNKANTLTQMPLVKILMCTSHCSSYQHVEHILACMMLWFH